MKLSFASPELRNIIQDPARLEVALGRDAAIALQAVLSELEAADNLGDVIAFLMHEVATEAVEHATMLVRVERRGAPLMTLVPVGKTSEKAAKNGDMDDVHRLKILSVLGVGE